MKTAIVYSKLSEESSLDNQDTLVQVDEISHLLKEMGGDVKHFVFDTNALAVSLQDFKPDFIFNLVETVEGKDALCHVATSFFDGSGIPYSGCSTQSLKRLADKMQQKEALRKAGLPTADFFDLDTASSVSQNDALWIVKSSTEHASVGIDAKSIVQGRDAALEKIREKQNEFGGSWFAERFIDGREFNISLLDKGNATPEVLPPAEINFVGYTEDMPKIVDYAAKWNEDSFAYNATPRSFDFSDKDNALLKELKEICLHCWNLFDLKGSARVDFRVDTNGKPWILEVNPNPCLSSDAGLMAAAAQAGLTPIDVIKRHLNKSEVPMTQLSTIRTTVKETDGNDIRALVKGTGVFNEEEIDIAGELAEEALTQGEEKSGYSFIFSEQNGKIAGYTCYGRIPFTAESYDLYWIAVDKSFQKAGLAKQVLALTEQAVAELGGKQLYAETSGTDHYIAARSFYLKNGFEEVARLKNFYKQGDDKVIFCKMV